MCISIYTYTYLFIHFFERYPTKYHLKQIQTYGLSPIHRKTLTEYELVNFFPKEITLSIEVLQKYIEQCFGFAVFELEFLSERDIVFLAKLRRKKRIKFTPKMAYRIKQAHDNAMKNALRKRMKLSDIPPIPLTATLEWVENSR